MYLFLDVETGGIGLDKSLLTLGMIVTDQDFSILDGKEYKIRPDDGVYQVTGESLKINKIDLSTHDKEALSYKEVGSLLYHYLKTTSYNGKIKLIPVGKNIASDINQIWDKLLSRESWEHFVSYQQLDISSVWRYLELTKKVPMLHKTSLSDLCNHFNISIPCTWLHTALGDCRLYIELMQRLVQL